MKILNNLALNQDDRRSMALLFNRVELVSFTAMPELSALLTSQELASYIVLACISTLSRSEIKNTVNNNSTILSLLEESPNTA